MGLEVASNEFDRGEIQSGIVIDYSRPTDCAFVVERCALVGISHQPFVYALLLIRLKRDALRIQFCLHPPVFRLLSVRIRPSPARLLQSPTAAKKLVHRTRSTDPAPGNPSHAERGCTASAQKEACCFTGTAPRRSEDLRLTSPYYLGHDDCSPARHDSGPRTRPTRGYGRLTW